jgi:hypothetical protein
MEPVGCDGIDRIGEQSNTASAPMDARLDIVVINEIKLTVRN